MSADSGSSFGTRGTVSSFRPASCGRRLPFFAFTALLDHTRFSHASLPPRDRGTTWSRLPSWGFSTLPVYWQRLPSRSRIVFAHSFGRLLGTLAKFTATMTVGTRIGPRTVCTALSWGRTGSVIHSSHVSGRSASARAACRGTVAKLNFQRRGHVGGHHAKGLLRRAHVDGLPVAVEHQHDRLVQNL